MSLKDIALGDLFLRHFATSRLSTYERVACYTLDDQLIGAVGLCRQGDKLCLNQLCVDVCHRRKGVASKLLDFVAKTNAHMDLILYVDNHKPETKSLLAFYCKRGFKIVESQNDAEYLLLKTSVS